MNACVPKVLPRTRPAQPARVLCVGLGALLLGSGSAFAADPAQSTNDLWDVSQGTIVTATSGIRGGFAPTDMFGDSASSWELGNTVFSDGQPDGFVHSIEWQTPVPVRIGSFALFAGGDGPAFNNEREFDRFILKARSSGASDFDLILCDYTPAHPYPILDATAEPLLLTNTTPVTAQRFRAEFVQHTAGRGFDGPRIVELDGYAPDCVSAPTGLVGWWRAEEDAGDSAGTNEGSAENGLGYAAGQVGQTFLLDGIDDEVLIPASPSLNVRSFTIEGWINPSDVAVQRPVVEWCATNDYAGVHLWISVVPQGGASLPGTLWANVRDASNGSHLLTSAPGLIASNQWSHVALTYDQASGNARLFLNGATVASADLGSFVPKTGVPLHLGRRPTSCYETWPGMVPFAGRLDEISLYDRALPPAEVQAVFAGGSAGKCPAGGSGLAPLAHWRFEETGGTVAHDSTGAFPGNLSPTGATLVPGGIAGQALYVDRSSNGLVNMGKVLGLETGDFSLVAWIRMNAGDTSESSLIVGKHVSGYPNGYGLFANSSGGFGLPARAWFYDSGAWFGTEVISTTTVNDGSWHQVVGVYQAGGAKQVYVDGAPAEASGSAVPIVGNTDDFIIGGLNSGGAPVGSFTGWIDEVQVYGRTLSAPEVDFLFRNPAQGLPGCVTSPSGLVAWWPGETNALDTAGSNAGTLQGETSFESGVVGSGFRFDGTNDCLVIPFVSALDLTNYSVEAWVKPLSQVDDPVNQELIFGQGFGKPQLAVRPGTNGVRVAFMFAESLTSFPAAVSTNEIPIRQFSHLAGTWDGATLRIYVDGVLSGATPTARMPAASTCPFYIGGFQDSCGFTGQFFNGIVDEVGLYSRALPVEEIQAVFHARSAGRCPPPPPTAPEITVNPASQRVPRGSDVTFRVTATGTPPLFYHWYFSTNALEVRTNDLLTLTNIQPAAEGGYSVIVSNASGSATSAVAQLTLTVPPVITVQPQGQSVVIGSRVVFSVTAVGAEPLSYSWRRNGLSVPSGTGQILILNNVQTQQAGTYTVRVSNADGSVVSAPAVLKVGSAQLSLLPTGEGPQLNVVGQTNVTYLIEISSNLLNWSTLATEVGPPANWSFTDPTADGVDRRFYRLRRSP